MARKKIVKRRGYRTHGWGSQKKHRGGGSRGGRGRGGVLDQKKVWLLKRGEKLGKRGFKSLKQRGLKPSGNAINLRDVEKLAGNKKEINLLDYGYERVLGSGEIKKPLKVKAKHFSARTKDKIKKVKGEVINV
ncbi:MAG: uL15 family ribosomal protein [Candidatus Aenigmatarchaeota archaeon]|nr:MAG: uL15 family ribosomal protein [Candidatus Aenigmarchaeota archaeon]